MVLTRDANGSLCGDKMRTLALASAALKQRGLGGFPGAAGWPGTAFTLGMGIAWRRLSIKDKNGGTVSLIWRDGMLPLRSTWIIGGAQGKQSGLDTKI